jgi:hypothetical protein
MASFTGFIYSDLHGTVVVHDRYVNYDLIDGISHQLCIAHLLRDIEDAAQTCPEAKWPAQVAEHLRGLIHQANLARDKGLASVPGNAIAEHLRLFRNGVNVGLSEIRRIPGGKKVKQPPALHLLECLRDRQADVLRFLTGTAIPAHLQPLRYPISASCPRGLCLTTAARSAQAVSHRAARHAGGIRTAPGKRRQRRGAMRQLRRSHNHQGR